MLLDDRPFRRQVQHCVVDRSAVRLFLRHPDHEPDAVFPGNHAETVRRRAWYDDRVFREQPEPVRVAIPDWLRVDPDRSARDEDLGEDHELCSLRRGGSRQLGDPIDRRVAVHQHVRGLDSRHSQRRHSCPPLTTGIMTGSPTRDEPPCVFSAVCADCSRAAPTTSRIMRRRVEDRDLNPEGPRI